VASPEPLGPAGASMVGGRFPRYLASLFANDLDQHALAAPSVELAIKNLLPRTEVEFTRRDRDYDLPPHNLAFHVGIGIVLAGSVT
jgi:hypothetical protein